MWISFTEHARRVVFYAQEQAVRLDDNDCVATQILTRLQVNLPRLRAEMEDLLTSQNVAIKRNDVQLAKDGKKIVDNAYQVARSLSSRYIRSEHLLLSLTQLEAAPGGKILREHGVTYEKALQAMLASRS